MQTTVRGRQSRAEGCQRITSVASRRSSRPSSHSRISSRLSRYHSTLKNSYLQIISKIGYRNVDESAANKFQMLTQFMKKQLDTYLIKNQPGIALFNSLLNPNCGEGVPATTTDSRSVYSNNNKSAPNQQQMIKTMMMSPQNIYYELSPNQQMQIQFEHKRSSGSEFATAGAGGASEYIVPNAFSQQQLAQSNNGQHVVMSSSHSTNWRGISSSEVKSVNGT